MNLKETEDSILTYLRTNYGQFTYYHGPVPEDEQLIRDADGEVPPFFIVRFGKVNRSGRAVAGHRHDEYHSWVDMICISTVHEQARTAVDLILDGLTGFRPTGGSPMWPDGGQQDFVTRNYASRPVLSAQSQRFTYGINAHPSNSRLAPPVGGYGTGSYGSGSYGG